MAGSDKPTRLQLDQGDYRGFDIQVPADILAEIQDALDPDNVGALNFDNIPIAYSIVSRWLAQVDNQTVDFDTQLWFSQAYFINSGLDPASEFLRAYTNYAAGKDGELFTDAQMTDAQMQEISDRIGESVLTHIMTTGEIPPMGELLYQEIVEAIGIPAFGVPGDDAIPDYSRWGGTFYYWNIPALDFDGEPITDALGNPLTIGEVVLSRLKCVTTLSTISGLRLRKLEVPLG